MDEREKEEYDLMMELDRLESLQEEMEELGLNSISDIEARKAEVNEQLEQLLKRDS